MRIRVLTVPACPNAPLAMERIDAALAGREAEVELVEVADEAAAAACGMTGSPTILLDGADPFGVPGARPSVSCRLYRAEVGRPDGAPSEAALRTAIEAALRTAVDAAEPGRAPRGGDDCCEADPTGILDAVGRDGRGRRAPAGRGLRAVQQAVLRHFAATGTAPAVQALEPVAAAAGRTAGAVLAELAREDFLTVDEAGRIRAAYPFSAVRTRHRVRIAGGCEVWSMCAIDALGIPAMLGAGVRISSTDPVTGGPVTVTGRDAELVWEPADAVVFVGRRSGGGPAATSCCDVLNFFTGEASARTWTERHPEVRGRVVGQGCAEDIGRRTFGPLLAP